MSKEAESLLSLCGPLYMLKVSDNKKGVSLTKGAQAENTWIVAPRKEIFIWRVWDEVGRDNVGKVANKA